MTLTAFAVSILTNAAIASEGSFWFPPQASTTASTVDWVYYFIYWISVFFTVMITAAAIYFCVKFRSKKTAPAAAAAHNTALEIVWTVVPGVLCVFIFYFGLTGYMDTKTAPDDSYEIHVTGQKWNWTFTYPNGAVAGELHVPVHRPVRLIMTSNDVIHSFFIPAFRTKQDVVPGRYSEEWFEANEVGEFQVFCTEYCGTSHSAMLTKTFVHEQSDFDEWLHKAGDIHEGHTPAEAGEILTKQRGCLVCHSLDGSRKTGPSWQGIWGRNENLSDGSNVKVEENYIRQSILQPQSQIVAGYPGSMPTYQGQLKDKDITAIIEYLKTLR
ncbi:MAG: cytochrome c oxidase subunit II [Clostridia bacterium]|nr:cytochrome c oxidase subunit II [Deltaproteobacteria bacterium]